MKKAYTMIALLVLIGSMAMAANAQNNGRSQMRASIPFQFNVGDESLPAGDYIISQLNPASDQVIVRISARDGSSQAVVLMSAVAGKTANNSSLLFNRYGNKYYFAQAWTEGDSEGLRTFKSRSERATQKEMTALKVQRETVALRIR